jgi:hypothetical protein
MPLPGSTHLPPGINLRPLAPDDHPPLIAAAVTESPASLILLRETPDALVYAGALCDAAGRVLQWLEIWVQRVTASPFFQLGNVTGANAERDARWDELRRGFAEAEPGRVVATGRENAPSPPLWWDTRGHPLRVEGEASVTTSDEALTAAGLPGYASGEHRYLSIRGPGGLEWMPLTPSAPVSTAPIRPAPAAALAFNPDGGHWFCRFAAPFSAGDYTAAVSSGQWPEPGPRLNSAAPPPPRDVRHQPGFYLRAWHGQTPPLAEILHLKLSLLHGLLTAAESAIRSRRLPLLNLKTRSFGLDWAGERAGLALWTVQPVLDQPSAATRWLAGGDGDDPVFLLVGEPPASIYRHPDITAPRFVRGNVRLSQLRAVGSQKDHLESEGTLILTESLPRATDTVLIQCPFAAHAISANISALEPSRGEILFRTARWRPAPGIAASLASGGQAPPPVDCDCALVPRLSSPADLYALGVTALEILCGGSGQGLPMIVDEALRVAQRLGQEKVPLDAIPDTLAAWQRREPDANWTAVLSPRHLASPPPDADTAARMVPAMAWHSALSWTLRLLTGSCSQAYFQSAGEGSPQSPQLAFEQPLKDLRALLHRTRALVSMEWKANLEIRDQIMAVMEK